jgi:hypothetical protein
VSRKATGAIPAVAAAFSALRPSSGPSWAVFFHSSPGTVSRDETGDLLCPFFSPLIFTWLLALFFTGKKITYGRNKNSFSPATRG